MTRCSTLRRPGVEKGKVSGLVIDREGANGCFTFIDSIKKFAVGMKRQERGTARFDRQLRFR